MKRGNAKVKPTVVFKQARKSLSKAEVKPARIFKTAKKMLGIRR